MYNYQHLSKQKDDSDNFQLGKIVYIFIFTVLYTISTYQYLLLFTLFSLFFQVGPILVSNDTEINT